MDCRIVSAETYCRNARQSEACQCGSEQADASWPIPSRLNRADEHLQIRAAMEQIKSFQGKIDDGLEKIRDVARSIEETRDRGADEDEDDEASQVSHRLYAVCVTSQADLPAATSCRCRRYTYTRSSSGTWSRRSCGCWTSGRSCRYGTR